MVSGNGKSTVVPEPTEASTIETRVAELESRVEANEFGQDAEHRSLLIDEIRQRIKIKWISLIAGYLIVTLLVFLVWSVAAASIFFGYANVSPTVVIAALVAPILAMTAITAILLVGAFRATRPSDIERVNIPSLVAEAIRSGGGG